MLPLLPEPSGLTPEQIRLIRHLQEESLQVSEGLKSSLFGLGWLYAGSNRHVIFFERPGYWLRLYPEEPSYTAMIEPGNIRVPRRELRDAGRQIPFQGRDLVQPITGNGAKARIREAVLALWQDHAGYLAELGIALKSVAVWQAVGTGNGSLVSKQSYSKWDVDNFLTQLRRKDQTPSQEHPAVSPAP